MQRISPMAGVHSFQQYIDVLIEQGFKVTVRTMEDPKEPKGWISVEVYVDYIENFDERWIQTSQNGENNFLICFGSFEK